MGSAVQYLEGEGMHGMAAWRHGIDRINWRDIMSSQLSSVVRKKERKRKKEGFREGPHIPDRNEGLTTEMHKFIHEYITIPNTQSEV